MTKDNHKGVNDDYSGDNIEALEGLEPVRKRIGMYIGSSSNLTQLLTELKDNSIDEFGAGYGDRVKITIYADNSASVEDNGRGIPVDEKIHQGKKMSALEMVLTVLHAGGKFGAEDSGYKASGGLHGVGSSVVNALSEEMEATVYRNGRKYSMTFSRGIPTSELIESDMPEGMDPNHTGTKIWFKPDYKVMTVLEFDYSVIQSRVRDSSFLNPGLTLELIDKRGEGKHEVFKSENGLADYVEHLNKHSHPVTEIIHMKMPQGEDFVGAEVAMQWNKNYSDKIFSYANHILTSDGGSHLVGFTQAVLKTINAYARNEEFLKEKDEDFKIEDVKEGLAAVISVKLLEPEFEGQTKGRLGTPFMRGVVNKLVTKEFGRYLEENPDQAKIICEKVEGAARARISARAARERTRSTNILEATSMPDKLADCSDNDPEKAELFVVEGNSAGGSAKGARDRRFQAILPLRGKILNVERARADRIYDNAEIMNIVSVLGTGIGEDFDMNKLRYHKLVILTDADVDGSHIRTLILTLLYRKMPQLIEAGKVYIGRPPLYENEAKKGEYFQDDAELIRKTAYRVLDKIAIVDADGNEHIMDKEEFRHLTVQSSRINSQLEGLNEKYGGEISDLLARWHSTAGGGTFDELIEWGSRTDSWPRFEKKGDLIRLKMNPSTPYAAVQLSEEALQDEAWRGAQSGLDWIKENFGPWLPLES